MDRFPSLAVLASALALGAVEPLVTVRPPDTGKALLNPGMGWVFHHYDNSIRAYGPPRERLFPGFG